MKTAAQQFHPEVKELTALERTTVSGGQAPPPIIALSPMKVTWKYIDGTPAWAIANALAAGYEVENIS